jgi:hypothetical protein
MYYYAGDMDMPTNTFQWRGKVAVKTEREKAPVCICGNKYLKTRKNQKECLICILGKAKIKKAVGSRK